MCDEWRNDFETFYDWAIKNGYKRGLQIDRVDVNYGYIPNNCRWVTTSVQARNKRNTILVEYKGEAICLQDLANKTGLSRSTLLYRYRNNKPLVPEAI